MSDSVSTNNIPSEDVEKDIKSEPITLYDVLSDSTLIVQTEIKNPTDCYTMLAGMINEQTG